jgi:hypothetical protein
VKRSWEVNGYSLSGLEMRWAAIWTVTQVSWQLWITPLRVMDGFSGKEVAKRSIFKGMFASLIRDAFNLGLRNDVIDQTTNHQIAGWKGLRALEAQEPAEKKA